MKAYFMYILNHFNCVWTSENRFTFIISILFEPNHVKSFYLPFCGVSLNQYTAWEWEENLTNEIESTKQKCSWTFPVDDLVARCVLGAALKQKTTNVIGQLDLDFDFTFLSSAYRHNKIYYTQGWPQRQTRQPPRRRSETFPTSLSRSRHRRNNKIVFQKIWASTSLFTLWGLKFRQTGWYRVGYCPRA